MSTCPSCGKVVPDNTAFCPECGAPQPAQQPQAPFGQPQNNQNQFNQNQYQQDQYNQNQYQQGGYGNPNQQWNQGGYGQGQFQQQSAPYVGSNGYATERNIIVCVLLSIVTCGLYTLYWVYCLHNEMNAISQEPEPMNGALVILLFLVTCGIFPMIWYYKMGTLTDRIKGSNGNTGIIFLLLVWLVGVGQLISLAMIQDTVNNVARGTR